MIDKLFISSDHGGYRARLDLLNQLEGLRSSNEKIAELEIVDIGPIELVPDDDYPDFAFALAEQVAIGHFGILICRSGIGMCIAANKVKGVYAAVCSTEGLAQVAREHNDANVLVLDSDYQHDDMLSIVLRFISTEFAGGRHARRVEKIKTYEVTH